MPMTTTLFQVFQVFQVKLQLSPGAVRRERKNAARHFSPAGDLSAKNTWNTWNTWNTPLWCGS